MKTLGWAVLALMLVSGPVVGQDDLWTVRTLHYICKGEKKTFIDGYCLGRLTGINSMVARFGMGKKWKICIPTETTNVALRQVFNSWAKKHIEHWEKSDLFGVLKAFQGTWPCPEK